MNNRWDTVEHAYEERKKRRKAVFVIFTTISNDYFIKSDVQPEWASYTQMQRAKKKKATQITTAKVSVFRSLCLPLCEIQMPQYSLILRICNIHLSIVTLSHSLFVSLFFAAVFLPFVPLLGTYIAHNSMLRSWQHWHIVWHIERADYKRKDEREEEEEQ